MANAADYTVRDYLKSLKYEALKLFRVYDVVNRVEFQYEAPVQTKNGELCMRTEYIYDGTSNRVIAMKESLDNWQSVWDI